jgi:hypothetical protein
MHCIRLGLTIQWPTEYRGFDLWLDFKKNSSGLVQIGATNSSS